MPAAEQVLDAVRGLPGVGMLEPARVSLGYPWRAAAESDPDLVARVAATTAPFTLRFLRVAAFDPDLRGRVVVHLVPEDDAPVRRLAAAVGGDLRDTHLSVARVLPDGDVQAVLDAVAPLLPLEAPVDELELDVQVERRWQGARRFRLTGGG